MALSDLSIPEGMSRLTIDPEDLLNHQDLPRGQKNIKRFIFPATNIALAFLHGGSL
jgi:hypothetical protein